MRLGTHFLDGQIYREHHSIYDSAYRIKEEYFKAENFENELPAPIYFKNNKENCCFAINADRSIYNDYFIGIDWISEKKTAVYVQPKVNNDATQINYLAMLFTALKHPDVADNTSKLFEIKWEKPEIQINQQQDMLTPLLVLQYLQVVKNIVRKGLKKSYYKVEQNLHSRVKGKILISKNIKQNLSKSRTLNNICSFDEFGFNSIENRILKKALVFVQRYLAISVGPCQGFRSNSATLKDAAK
jgi:5-methylcytosine-specific restriction enzyme subunit McrC